MIPLWWSVFNITLGFISFYSRPICTDSGVWLDGHVSCTYLEKPSGYGIHNNQEGFCQKYHKECCLTCNRLKQKGFTTVISKPNTAQASTTNEQQQSCTETGVWLLDGKVSCAYLEQPSGYGIHNDQRGFCQNHYRECCKTCSKLEKNGFTYKAGSVTTPSETTATATKRTTVKDQNTSTSQCKDSGFWMIDGKVSCDYIEKQSGYGLHTNPESACQKYQKECCETCTRLQQNGFKTNSDVTVTTLPTTIQSAPTTKAKTKPITYKSTTEYSTRKYIIGTLSPESNTGKDTAKI